MRAHHAGHEERDAGGAAVSKLYEPGKVRVVIAGSRYEVLHDHPCYPVSKHDHGYCIRGRQAFPQVDHDCGADTDGLPNDVVDVISAMGREVWIVKPDRSGTIAQRGRVESAAEALSRAEAQITMLETVIEHLNPAGR